MHRFFRNLLQLEQEELTLVHIFLTPISKIVSLTWRVAKQTVGLLHKHGIPRYEDGTNSKITLNILSNISTDFFFTILQTPSHRDDKTAHINT